MKNLFLLFFLSISLSSFAQEAPSELPCFPDYDKYDDYWDPPYPIWQDDDFLPCMPEKKWDDEFIHFPLIDDYPLIYCEKDDK